MKIWIKLMKDEKIYRDTVYEQDALLVRANFEKTLRAICEKMDIPNPLVLPARIREFENFNRTVFRGSEFVESIPFDFMTIEIVPEKKKKSDHPFNQ